MKKNKYGKQLERSTLRIPISISERIKDYCSRQSGSISKNQFINNCIEHCLEELENNNIHIKFY